MPEIRHLTPDLDAPMLYQICIRGHLGCEWSEWFEGMAVTPQDDGDTLIVGLVVDQAALFGLLKKVRDLGMPLISVMRLIPNETDTLP